MNKNHLRNSILIGVISGLVPMTTAQADGRHALWTFEPIAGYPPAVTVSTTGTANIKYTVTNWSYKPHTLQMQSIKGIEPSGCNSPLGHRQSCILNLSITGSALTGDVLGGPVLCEQSNKLQCYQPSQENSLAIRLTPTPPPPPIQQYTVTPSAGANGLISPSTAQVVNSGATITFTATPDAGYGVNQWLVDGNLVQTGGTTYQLSNITANHAVNVTFGTATLISSISTLALSINCNTISCTALETASLTGNPRLITIQNTGTGSATNLAVSTSGLPSGTSITNDTCNGTLNGGGSCTITLTPGNIASSDASNNPCTSGTQPVAGSVTITADGGLSNQVNVYVLGYGCQYQGGFIYSVDDSYTDYPETGSIGGKVITTTDQSASGVFGFFWDSSSGCTTNPWDSCYTTNADSATNGANLSGGNTYLINYTLYTIHGEGQTTFAAGLCTRSIDNTGAVCTTGPNCYSDWYLPTICEMGYGAVFGSINCGIQTSPTLQNIQSNLVDSNIVTNLTTGGSLSYPGYYWSSTEDSTSSTANAGYQLFASGGSSYQASDFKGDFTFGVRCSRIF